MTPRPTAQELIDAAREHFATHVLPAIADPRLRFQTLVATHVLGVVSRELSESEAHAWREWAQLVALLDAPAERPPTFEALQTRIRALNADLCAAIRSGRFDTPDAALVLRDILRAQVTDALQLWNPAFLWRVTQ
jgi:hypothetical protein